MYRKPEIWLAKHKYEQEQGRARQNSHQHQEQISPNHMQALFLGPVQYVQIEYVLHFIKKVLCSSDFRHYTIS